MHSKLSYCPLICDKADFFEIAYVVDTRLPRFEALAYALPHFDEQTCVVIRASSAFIIKELKQQRRRRRC